ncbi:hypothetical protein EDD85DRAFT_798014 [Armillaria nabsnona]|nr:hypothetical protein EDD85DRAFT_798014 [Armillaria nabsnona]
MTAGTNECLVVFARLEDATISRMRTSKQPVAVKVDDDVNFFPPSLRLDASTGPRDLMHGVGSDEAYGYQRVGKSQQKFSQSPHGSPPQMYDHILPLLNCSRSVCEVSTGDQSIRLIWLSSSARPPEPSTKSFGELTKVLVLVRKWKEGWVRRRVDDWRYEQMGVDGRLECKTRIDAWGNGRLQHTPPRRKMDVRGASRRIQVGRVKASSAPFPSSSSAADCRGLIFGVCPRFMSHLRTEDTPSRIRIRDGVLVCYRTGQQILSMYRGQDVHIRGARGEEGVRRDIDVGSGSRLADDMTTRHTPSTRLLVYRSRLAVDDTTWFSGVGT